MRWPFIFAFYFNTGRMFTYLSFIGALFLVWNFLWNWNQKPCWIPTLQSISFSNLRSLANNSLIEYKTKLNTNHTINYRARFKDPNHTINYRARFKDPNYTINYRATFKDPNDTINYRTKFKDPNHTINYRTTFKDPNHTINYRARFKDGWNELNPNVGFDSLVDARKYMIYRCGPGMLGCGGWADRVKGMILGYMLANLTGRVFKIDFRDPDCDITNYLIPNKVDWRLPKPFHEIVKVKNPPPDTVVLDYVNHSADLFAFKKTNVSQIFNQSVQYVYIKANTNYVDYIYRNKVYSEKVSWMQNLRIDEIYSELYRRLFRLSPELQKRMEVVLGQYLPTPQHKLICAHIRMGRNSDIQFKNEPIRMTPASLPNVWKFISQHSISDHHKVFIMSDSNDTMRDASSQSFAPRMISSPGVILHIDRKTKYGTESRCQALEKVIFDQAILMNCDVLLISKSGLSRMAAYVRGSVEDLFCLSPSGDIRAVSRRFHITC